MFLLIIRNCWWQNVEPLKNKTFLELQKTNLFLNNFARSDRNISELSPPLIKKAGSAPALSFLIHDIMHLPSMKIHSTMSRKNLHIHYFNDFLVRACVAEYSCDNFLENLSAHVKTLLGQNTE